MRRLLIGSAAIAAAMIATPAAAQIGIRISTGYAPYSYGYSPYSYGYSPYSYGYRSYGYSPYSYGYSPYSYGYSYPGYSYGYSYPSYSYGYSSYSSPRYRTSSCLRKHHRNGVTYYTRVC